MSYYIPMEYRLGFMLPLAIPEEMASATRVADAATLGGDAGFHSTATS